MTGVRGALRDLLARLRRPTDPPPSSGRPDTRPDATIVPHEDGPLVVRGRFRLRSQHDTPIPPGRSTIALCRCGASDRKPFCDGSHRTVGFRAASAPTNPRPGQEDAS